MITRNKNYFDWQKEKRNNAIWSDHDVEERVDDCSGSGDGRAKQA